MTDFTKEECEHELAWIDAIVFGCKVWGCKKCGFTPGLNICDPTEIIIYGQQEQK